MVHYHPDPTSPHASKCHHRELVDRLCQPRVIHCAGRVGNRRPELNTSPDTKATITQLAQEVDKHKATIHHANQISAQESIFAQEALDEHKQEIEWPKGMIREMTIQQNNTHNQPKKFSIETPPKRGLNTVLGSVAGNDGSPPLSARHSGGATSIAVPKLDARKDAYREADKNNKMPGKPFSLGEGELGRSESELCQPRAFELALVEIGDVKPLAGPKVNVHAEVQRGICMDKERPSCCGGRCQAYRTANKFIHFPPEHFKNGQFQHVRESNTQGGTKDGSCWAFDNQSVNMFMPSGFE